MRLKLVEYKKKKRELIVGKVIDEIRKSVRGKIKEKVTIIRRNDKDGGEYREYTPLSNSNWDHPSKNKTELGESKPRDYKAEYKKYGSSTKAKKYRAELNKYNRQKGTYGNGDKKDASHKGGKIVGYEEQSKNRGRREKSRLKKEATVRLSPQKDVNFGSNFLQLLGKKGKIRLDKRSVHQLAKLVRTSKAAGMGFSFTAHEVKESKLNEAKVIKLPSGAKVKLEFKGATFIGGGRGKPVFLDRGELAKFFMATSKYLRENKLKEDFGMSARQLPSFSSKEAKKIIDDGLRMWSKDLKKTQYRIIKDWMSKAKAGAIDYFDIVRGIQVGDASRANPYEVEFLHSLLNKDKIMNRFRSYFGGKKGLPRNNKK